MSRIKSDIKNMYLEIFPETVSRVDWTNGERQTVPCTGCCDGERQISKSV